MQSAEPNELGQASLALALSLLDVLASKGILARDDLDAIVTAAIAELEAAPMNEAAAFVKSLLPKLRTFGEPGRHTAHRRRSKQFLEKMAEQRRAARAQPAKRPTDGSGKG